MEISCAFPTSTRTPELVALAESLGYRRAWLYDSPALYAELFTTLGRCAERTSTIGLGTGVLIPSLRHPMQTAASITTLCDLAPGRIDIGVGSGFTGRYTMGKKPLPWSSVSDYVRCVQALLRGDQAEWEGSSVQMLHPPGFGASRPVEVPWIIGCEGPKGQAVARELGDGAFSLFPIAGFDRMVQLTFGTVLDEGEDPASERVLEAAGPAAAVILHGSYERGLGIAPEWNAAIEQVPAEVRHLATHDAHLVSLTERDRPYVTPELITSFTTTGTAKEIAERLTASRDAGVTEIAYQPAGPDLERELRAFIDAAGRI